MRLATMEPDADWEAATDRAAVETLRRHADGITIRVWGGDWCGDCQAVLPDFAAALRAAGIDPAEEVAQYPVEKAEDGSKVGPRVEEYGIEYIPTIVLEYEGEEITRFVEAEPESPTTYLARAISDHVAE